jgi:hypothetical protein
MRFNDDGDSNEIVASDLQDKKHSEQRISTPDGIIIDSNDEYEKANDSMHFNDDGDSNEIVSSD